MANGPPSDYSGGGYPYYNYQFYPPTDPYTGMPLNPNQFYYGSQGPRSESSLSAAQQLYPLYPYYPGNQTLGPLPPTEKLSVPSPRTPANQSPSNPSPKQSPTNHFPHSINAPKQSPTKSPKLSKESKVSTSSHDVASNTKRKRRKEKIGVRSACDFCKKSKHACIRQEGPALVPCERCQRLDKDCTLNGVIATGKPEQSIEISLVTPKEPSLVIQPVTSNDRVFFAQYSMALNVVSQRLFTLASTDGLGRMIDLFFDNLQHLMPIVNHRQFQSKGWLAQPLLSASILQVVYSVPRVTTSDTPSNQLPHIDREKMLALAESIFDIVEMSLIFALADSKFPTDNPLIPLHQLVTVIQAGMLAAMGWSISHLFFRVWKIHLLTIDVCTKWNLCKIDQVPHASIYVTQVWSKDPSPLAFGSGAETGIYREVIRRIWGNLLLSDVILSATFDSAPSVTAEQAVIVRPPVPEEVWLNASDKEIAEFEYRVDGKILLNHEWTMHRKGSPDRNQALELACQQVQTNGPSLFSDVSVVVATLVLTNAERDGTADESFARRRELRSLIDDILSNLPESMPEALKNGEPDKVMSLVFTWFKPVDAIRFVVSLLRLHDMRILLQVTAPLYGVATQFYQLWQQFLRSDGIDAHEDASLLPLLETISKFRRRPLKSKSFQAATHDLAHLHDSTRPWLHLYPDSSLDHVLQDAITTSWLIRSLHRALRTANMPSVGTVLIPIVFRMAFVHISVLAAMATHGTASESGLIASSLNDAQSQIELVKELMDRPDYETNTIESKWVTMMQALLGKREQLNLGDVSLLLDAIHQETMSNAH
jgi:hypothetical protein